MRKRLAALAALTFALAACSSPTSSPGPSGGAVSPSAPAATTAEASPSSGPTASPASSEAPSAQPSTGTPQVFPPGAAVEVAVKELNMRRRPSTSARRVETLKRGQVLLISPVDNIVLGTGPVTANGYTWYPVMKIQVPGPDGKLPPLPTYPILLGTEIAAGWVAAGDGSRDYLTALAPRCPTTVDLAHVEGMLPAERIACFGAPIVLEGTYGCGGCGGFIAGTFKPEWLASPLEFGFLSKDATEPLGPLAIRFPPDGPKEPAAGTIIRVTLHVDDPRSARCTMIEMDDTGKVTFRVDPRTAVLYCRERLVVESYEVLGTNPDFPG